MVLSEKTDRVPLPINDQRKQVENVASEDAHIECFDRGNASKLALENRLPGLVVREAKLRLDNNRILLNELEITGAYNYDGGGFTAALGLLGSGALPVDLLIEPEDVPLSGLLDAIQKLASAELAGKVLVVPDV